MWDAQDEHKVLPSVVDLTVNPNVLQATASLATLNSNSASNASLLNATTTTSTPTPSLAIMPNVSSTGQLSQSQLSISLPNSLLQSTNSLLQTSQLLSNTTTNSSTTTLASIGTSQTAAAAAAAANSNGPNLSSSLTANELNTRFDVWAECLAELFVYKNILKVPLTRIEGWRLIFIRLQQLFPSVDPK